MIEGSSDFIGGVLSLNARHFPAKIGGLRNCGSGDMFSICHVILQSLVIKGPCGKICRSPSR